MPKLWITVIIAWYEPLLRLTKTHFIQHYIFKLHGKQRIFLFIYDEIKCEHIFTAAKAIRSNTKPTPWLAPRVDPTRHHRRRHHGLVSPLMEIDPETSFMSNALQTLNIAWTCFCSLACLELDLLHQKLINKVKCLSL